jgi:hypothetical protein
LEERLIDGETENEGKARSQARFQLVRILAVQSEMIDRDIFERVLIAVILRPRGKFGQIIGPGILLAHNGITVTNYGSAALNFQCLPSRPS